MARELLPCGTEAAWQRHRLNAEEPCEECKRARRAAQNERNAVRAGTAAVPPGN